MCEHRTPTIPAGRREELARERAAAMAAFVADAQKQLAALKAEHDETRRQLLALQGENARLADRVKSLEGKPKAEAKAVELLRRWLYWVANTGQRGAYGADALCADTRRHLEANDNPAPGARHVPVDDGGLRGHVEVVG